MGDVCTRDCRFCASKTGITGVPLDEGEIVRIIEAVDYLNLGYVVLTGVCRDDLPLCGAEHFARAISSLKDCGCVVEALIPDFNGDPRALQLIVEAQPDVVGHNVETVPRLQSVVRCREAGYHKSLSVLRYLRDAGILVKSSLMLGFGEGEEEVLDTMQDLRSADVDMLTMGQYLAPSKQHASVVEYVPPERFDHYRRCALDMGFRGVVSGPFVRSSYKARELFNKLQGLSV
jgi:lipoic acid synthetase